MLYPIELRARSNIIRLPARLGDANVRQFTHNDSIMNDPLLLFGPKRLLPFAESLLLELKALGLNASLGNSPEQGAVHLLLLDAKTGPEELYADVPWLKEQFDFSSLRGFRMMPFLVFDSRVEDVESLDDEPIAETLEEVISGEFKPYGYDKAKKNPLEEFLSVLEEYDE